MVKEDIRTDVANATVTLSRKVGRGVLVAGSLIVTAAHCVEFECSGNMVAGGYHFIEEIVTTQEELLKVRPLAVEPVKDIAVLGSLDDQYHCGEAVAFDEFCEKVKPVPLCLSDFEPFQEFSVYIYTHKKGWIKGKAHQCKKYDPVLAIETKEQVEPGTSGSPIVNESGELVGIVSHFSIAAGNFKSDGFAPRPHLTLPVWVQQQIQKNMK